MKEFLSTFETFASYLKLDYGEFQRGDANLTSQKHIESLLMLRLIPQEAKVKSEEVPFLSLIACPWEQDKVMKNISPTQFFSSFKHKKQPHKSYTSHLFYKNNPPIVNE